MGEYPPKAVGVGAGAIGLEEAEATDLAETSKKINCGTIAKTQAMAVLPEVHILFKRKAQLIKMMAFIISQIRPCSMETKYSSERKAKIK